jgi:hypothetical protein
MNLEYIITCLSILEVWMRLVSSLVGLSQTIGRVARALRDFEFEGAPSFGVGRAGILSGYPRSLAVAPRDSQ